MELVTIKSAKYIESDDLKIIVKPDLLSENPLILSDVNFVSCCKKYESIDSGKDYDEYVGRLSLKQLIKKLEKDGYKTAKIYAYIYSGISLYVGNNQLYCPYDNGLLGIVFHKEDYDNARLEDIVSRWEYFLNGCVYYMEVINSITQEQEDIFGDLYGEYEVQDLLKRYFGITISSQELLEIIEY